ncbi:MAG: fructosamine kinase family protein, partial [Prolixibacteraceae bacterium]|nr:fructosamine kinase family protein [Prolixibacteraceae bacterium]
MKPDSYFVRHLCSVYEQNYQQTLIVHRVKPLGGGCISHAVQLDSNQGKLFLKWNQGGPSNLFLSEAASLSALQTSNNSILTFPHVFLASETGEFPAFLLTSFLEHGPCTNADEMLGQGLAMLHQNIHHQYGFAVDNYCGATLQNNHFQVTWIQFYTENRLQHLVNLIGKFREWHPVDQKVFDQFLRKLPELLCHQPQPSLIHGDLWSGNLLNTVYGPALIDPCVSYSDRELELGMMTLFGGFSPRVFDAYHEVFPLPDGW